MFSHVGGGRDACEIEVENSVSGYRPEGINILLWEA